MTPRTRHAALSVLLAVAVGTAAAVAVTPLDPGKPELAVQTSDNANLVVERYELNYAGGNVDSVTVTVNNTQSTDLTGTVSVDARTLNGTTVANGTESSVIFGVTGTTTVTVDFASNPAPGSVDWLRIQLNGS